MNFYISFYLIIGLLLTVKHFYGPVFKGERKAYWWCEPQTKIKDTLTLFIFTILLWPLWLTVVVLIVVTATRAARKKAKVQLIFQKHSNNKVF